MSGWTALVPLRGRGERKTRLAGLLTAAERTALSQAMFAHVIDTLRSVRRVTQVAVLSDLRPEGWDGWLFEDSGRGLNTELRDAAQLVPQRLLVIHADLPLLTMEDVIALLDAAGRSGCAIAPDRHGTGTNAVALGDASTFAFGFGPGSCARHVREAPQAELVVRAGLGIDVDTPEDLAAAQTRQGQGNSP